MVDTSKEHLQVVPSIDQLLRLDEVAPLLDEYGHDLVVESLRFAAAELRAALIDNVASDVADSPMAVILDVAYQYLNELTAPSLKPVFNLTGTVLHTNLGRAPLPPEAD